MYKRPVDEAVIMTICTKTTMLQMTLMCSKDSSGKAARTALTPAVEAAKDDQADANMMNSSRQES